MNITNSSASRFVVAASTSLIALVSMATLAPLFTVTVLTGALSIALVALTVNSYRDHEPRLSAIALARPAERHPLAA